MFSWRSKTITLSLARCCHLQYWIRTVWWGTQPVCTLSCVLLKVKDYNIIIILIMQNNSKNVFSWRSKTITLSSARCCHLQYWIQTVWWGTQPVCTLSCVLLKVKDYNIIISLIMQNNSKNVFSWRSKTITLPSARCCHLQYWIQTVWWGTQPVCTVSCVLLKVWDNNIIISSFLMITRNSQNDRNSSLHFWFMWASFWTYRRDAHPFETDTKAWLSSSLTFL